MTLAAIQPLTLRTGLAPSVGNVHRAKRRCTNLVHALQRPTSSTEVPRLDASIDDELSKRPLTLDDAGYFLIKVDRQHKELIAEYFTNTINNDGLACDPDTGKVIPCTPGYVRQPTVVYRGSTAKEISIRIIETETSRQAVTRLEHANYLGREFQRAEMALISGGDYIQD